METDFTERRRHIRVFFDTLEETSCLVSADEKAVTLWSASVLDLSLGGLHLTLIGDPSISVGERLILNNLTHRTGLVCDEQISMEVRWVFARPEFRRLYVGCRFLALPEKSRGHLANLISVKLLEASTVRNSALNN